MDAKKVLEDLKRRFPNEPEYHQAVEVVLGTIEEEYNKHPEFDKPSVPTWQHWHHTSVTYSSWQTS